MSEEDMEDHQDRTVLAGELKAGSLSSTPLAGDINNSNTMEAIWLQRRILDQGQWEGIKVGINRAHL